MSYTPGIPRGLQRSIMRNVWSSKTDEFFGEQLEIQPMRRPHGANSQSEPDPSRKAFLVAGVFMAAREPHVVNQSESNKLAIALDRPHVSIAIAVLPAPVRIGDLIVRKDRGEFYEVKGMRADSMKARADFEVAQLGVQPPLGGDPNL